MDARLKSLGIHKLIVAGMQSEYCILNTCKGAHQLGFQVTLVSDAHSTYPSKTESAAEIRDRVNEELKGIVKLWRIEDLHP